MNTVEIALEIMGKGMGGIFAAAVMIMLAISILQHLTSGRK